jgi:hypothetical protein
MHGIYNRMIYQSIRQQLGNDTNDMKENVAVQKKEPHDFERAINFFFSGLPSALL